MTRISLAILSLGLGLGLVVNTAAVAEPAIGAPAPDFSLPDSDGNTRTLSEFAGRTVILEWTNYDCPFVRKHYDSGNMQQQQTQAVADGAVWLVVNSSSPGKQGHVDAEGARADIAKDGFASSAYLLDPEGTVGMAYGAMTTPHMYIIDGDGILQYKGGIDSIRSADQADIAKAKQYVPAALAELAAGQPVSDSNTRPYGCSVKYPGVD
ncbi:MAG: thioredoxin family protein [Xanthomonadales bacterium]|nr:thioredoxin family protein [Xanthomonadales bacterium]